MSEYDTKKSIQTRERAAEDAWLVFQRNVMMLSVAAIMELAKLDAIRLEDGSLAHHGGIGRSISHQTVYTRLNDARKQYADEFIKRPILDVVMEEDDRLEHLAMIHMNDARTADIGTDKRAKSLDAYLKVLESRRKLLGIDRPMKLEVVDSTTDHDDPASVKLKAAMQAAVERRDQMLADANQDDDADN